MIADIKKLTESIKSNLAELNSEISEDNLRAQGFFTEFDEEFEGPVAHVIFVVDTDIVDDNLEVLDEYCTRANEKLSEHVVFVYCVYRTAIQYTEDFKTAEWAKVIQEVTDV